MIAWAPQGEAASPLASPHHWPCRHVSFPQHLTTQITEPLPTAPEQDGLGAGSPRKRGHLTLNLKPFSAYLVISPLTGIWAKRLFPRCGGCGQASCPLCKVIQDVHPVCCSPSPTLLEEKVERMWPLADLRAGSTHSEALTPSSVLGIYILPIIRTVRAGPRMQPWESNVYMTGRCTLLNPIKASI